MPDVRLREIDESNISDHSHLRVTDQCYFLYEYTAHKNYAYSDTNSLISNLKKKPSERTTKGGWRYKEIAIDQCAKSLRDALNVNFLKGATLIPAPPSKAKNDPDYDDRMEKILRRLAPPGVQYDVRPLLITRASRPAAHSGDRPSVETLKSSWAFEEQLIADGPAIRNICIFDDVLTAGTTFRAMSDVLLARFPGVKVTGIFIARRAISYQFDNLDDADF